MSYRKYRVTKKHILAKPHLSPQKKYKNIINKLELPCGRIITFHSLLEKKVYLWLTNNKYNFEFQKKILILESPKKKTHYICDFVIHLKNKKNSIYIDTKSRATITNTFRLKKDLFEGRYNKKLHIAFDVQEVAKILMNE